ncbi:DUF726 domain-containing protein [Marinobacter salexigens]|uniref:DUF726 domain-containing protein n=1 Tax=Marinobacter salexigens TaxID=1925763 RepID=UPI0012907C3B|nr:DUF726 domain-containing protein [Marinobacter salexigens]
MFNRFKDQLDSAKIKAEKALSEGREQLSKTYVDVSGQLKERLEKEDPENLEAWCSWCGEYSSHTLTVARKVARSTYQCSGCFLPTVGCRYCENMAKAASLEVKNSELESEQSGKVGSFFKDNWSNELCSEHDGTTPDFSKARDTIEDLSGFSELMKPKQKNIYGAAKRGAAIAGGVAAVGTGAVFAAPGIAAALGTTGILGAAGTGTAISSLSGAALTSAAVAKLGVGGLAIVTAAGAGLGGKAGFGIAGSYLKDIPDFDFTPLRALKTNLNHQTIVVNGFLTENDRDTTDWTTALAEHQTDSQLWHLNWEAKTLRKLGSFVGNLSKNVAAKQTAKIGIAAASKRLAGSVNAAGWAYTAADMVGNPWHSAMFNAEKTGALLAEAISRTEGQSFTLIGHSLGARVVFFALMALATKEQQYIEDAVLVGGAVGRDERTSWLDASSAVKGTLYNCHSDNDDVLRFLYRTANAGLSSPAGLGPAVVGARNLDCTDFITGHNVWKENLPKVLQRIETCQA